MYAVNTSWKVLDQSSYEADCEAGRKIHKEGGAVDAVLAEAVSGINAGDIAWSTRWATLDDAIAFVRRSAAVGTEPTSDVAVIRSRYELVSRTLSEVVNDVGDRWNGSCLTAMVVTTVKPLPTDQNLRALETIVSNGANGASTIMMLDGDMAGAYAVAVSGDSFAQNHSAIASQRDDPSLVEVIQDIGARVVARTYFDLP